VILLLSSPRIPLGHRAGLALGVICVAVSTASAELTSLRIEDYATMPQTGSTAFPSATANSAYLARVNFMTDDPSDPNRFFVNDLNGPLYILNKTTKQFTEYLNFNGRLGATGLYEKLWTEAGFAGGFVTFQFDPGYADPSSNGHGKFYTVHVERDVSPIPPGPGNELPDNTNYPNLDLSNYGVTTSVDGPGGNTYKDVLVEWTDTNINNSTFEGSARELLRFDARDRIHPMGDIIFNPTASPDDDDWRVMYTSVGDAGNGEQSAVDVRRTPQLLSALGGKILRIIPDLAGGNIPSTVSPNGKYRIPDDNPFTGIADSNVRDEIWAMGLRNPHRMAWDVNPALDPSDPNYDHLIVNDIGLHTWEEVNILYRGTNYGYSQREGNQQLLGTNFTGPLPNPDTIPNEQICAPPAFTSCTTNGTITPNYPVIQYGHALAGQHPFFAGDSVSSGFVYRGSKIPQLYGKYLFGDITTGAIFYADFEEMLAADDGNPSTLATIHSLGILWDNPNDAPDDGVEVYTTDTSNNAIRGPMFQIVDLAYHARGGLDPNLPGSAAVTDPFGRSDIRIAIDAAGELYIFSKSDGMIRQIVGPERIPGDYNYDGVVNGSDYDEWKDTFGDTVPVAGLGADGNENGIVDAADFTVWRDHLMGGGEAAVSHPVPEPASVLLMIVAGLLIALIAGRRCDRAVPDLCSSTTPSA
jgi:hypothetical protein